MVLLPNLISNASQTSDARHPCIRALDFTSTAHLGMSVDFASCDVIRCLAIGGPRSPQGSSKDTSFQLWLLMGLMERLMVQSSESAGSEVGVSPFFCGAALGRRALCLMQGV